MTVAALNKLAEQVLAQPVQPESIDIIEDYSRVFGEWFAAEGAEMVQRQPIDAVPQLKELLEKHGRIMDLLRTLQVQTTTEMRTFHQRARGILSYVDVLPKHVSIVGHRKG